MLGTATTVHEALTDINAGRIDDAVQKLKENLLTHDRIDQYLQRGVKPTLVGPDGGVKPLADISQHHLDSKGTIWASPMLPASTTPMVQAASKVYCILSLPVSEVEEEEILSAWEKLGKKEATRLIHVTLTRAAKAKSEPPQDRFPGGSSEQQDSGGKETAQTVDAGCLPLTSPDGEPT